MPMSSAKYTLSPIKQLVDLNGDLVNFNLTFTVKSENKEPFYLVAVDQSLLDSEEPLDYKLVDTGIISGNIISDNNVHNNFYLVLKSKDKQKVNVEVNIETTEIAPNLNYQEQNQIQNELEMQQTQHMQQMPQIQQNEQTQNNSHNMFNGNSQTQTKVTYIFSKYIKYLFFGIIVSVIIYLIYTFFKNQDKSESENNIGTSESSYKPSVSLTELLQQSEQKTERKSIEIPSLLEKASDTNLSRNNVSSNTLSPEFGTGTKAVTSQSKNLVDELSSVLNDLDGLDD